MPRVTYGPKVEARARDVLEVLLLFAKGEVENSDRFEIKYCWQDEQSSQLRIETNLRTLEYLSCTLGKSLKKAQIREALKRMDDFLNILTDERVQVRGLEDWRFTLTLWSKDIAENLQQLTKEWQRRRPQLPQLPQPTKLPTDRPTDPILPPSTEESAYRFHQLLQDYLEALSDPDQKKLQNAIDMAFRLCDPAQDWIEEDRLDKLMINLSQVSYPGWSEVDGLTQFAVFLATLSENLTSDLYHEIKAFVEFRQFDFNFLLEKATRQKLKRQILSREKTEHLIIEVIPQEQSEGVRISIWDACHLSSPLLQDEIMRLEELPNFLETWLEDESELTEPTLHLFVPRYWLNLDISDRLTASELTLGSQYKLVMRTHLSLTPTGKQHYKLWQQKWQVLESKIQQTAQTTFVHADCSSPAKLFKTLKPATMAILDNLEQAKLAKVLEFVAKKTALPVALWSRRCELSDCIDTILDCEVGKLPEQILQERLDSLDKDDDHMGRHLTLVWEDPNIVPPTLQFDSEAC